MYDSRAAASNDEEIEECVLEDWRVSVYLKQELLKSIPLDDNSGISTSIKHQIDTLQNY